LTRALARNVQVKLILKFEETSEGQLSMDALNALGEFLELTITLGRKPTRKGE